MVSSRVVDVILHRRDVDAHPGSTLHSDEIWFHSTRT